MTDHSSIPPTEPEDRNADLRRQIGDALEKGSVAEAHPAPGDSSFFDALLEMRRHVDAETDQPTGDAAGRMWAGIEEATRKEEGESVRPARPRQLRESTDHTSRKPAARLGRHVSNLRTVQITWLSAAAVVLATAVITVLMLRAPEPLLVASAGETSLEYTTDDGSVVTLRAHSDLYQLDAGDSGARFRLEGEAFFDVTERSKGPFSVVAGTAIVEVLGTRFNLGTWSGETGVYLEEGRVRFAHATSGQDVILLPGQSSRTEGDDVLPPVAAAPARHTDWLEDALEFDQQPVHLIARELEQQYDVDLGIPDSLAAETLSGRLILGSVDESLQDLARALGGRFVPSGPDAYRFESQ